MGNKKIIMLVGSILLGALAGFALLGYVRGVEDDVREEVTRVPVWVVSGGGIAEGTTAATARSTSRLVESEIESGFRPANAITDLAEIEGQIAASNLVENQVLVAGLFADPDVVATTFSDQIAPNHVAFSITIPKQRAVNGFLSPGDFVDIIVLGDEPLQAGAEDAFESSLASSPYESPARTLFRGVRIESINNDIIGNVTADGQELPEDEAESNLLEIGLSIPSDAAQRVLSVSQEDIVLALLPPDWTPEEQENVVLPAIIVGEDLPGEDRSLITPYGSDGFVDFLADGVQEDPEAPEAQAEATPPAAEEANETDETEEEGQ